MSTANCTECKTPLVISGDICQRCASKLITSLSERAEQFTQVMRKLESDIEFYKGRSDAELAKYWETRDALTRFKDLAHADLPGYPPETVIRCEVTAGDIRAMVRALDDTRQAEDTTHQERKLPDHIPVDILATADSSPIPRETRPSRPGPLSKVTAQDRCVHGTNPRSACKHCGPYVATQATQPKCAWCGSATCGPDECAGVR